MTKEVSDTFCIFPWSHVHAWPDGKAMLCCIANGGHNMGEVGDISKNTFAEILNSEKYKQIRLDMLAGKRVEQCQSCYRLEDMGQVSFRQNTNIVFKNHIDDVLARTNEDGSINDPKMLYMDFRFSNLCNLGCRTCGHQLSSHIANESPPEFKERNLIPLREKNVVSEKGTITSFVYARPNFLEEDVYPYIDDVQAFYFAGGEPLMHREHSEILQYLIDNKQTWKKLTYSTNMTTFKWKGIDFLEKWKNFSQILFYCSIDSYGEKLEYIRDRSKNDVVMSSLRKLCDLKDSGFPGQFRVEICYTHSLYNAYYTREFFEYLDEIGLLERIDNVQLNYAYGDEHSLAILPDFAKDELREKRKQDLSSEALQKAFILFPALKQTWDGVETLIDETSEKSFHIFSRRLLHDNEKCKEALPWLASVVDRTTIA